ncbi:MAG: Gfo/Idh/MocA family oxidoreductase, partial [Thermomicrobiales bacterium]|nr:Gfo/Idh/MocA family oxidoreductase [Thermomicrobiales bacterium]
MPPRVAVVGCGRIAPSAHLPAWQAMAAAGRCALAGVTDLDPARAAQASTAFAVPAYPSVDALLAEARPDIVDITTLLDHHHDLTLQALAAGCHVLCEKPIARDAA